MLNQCKEFRKASYLPSSASLMGTSPYLLCHIPVSQILGQKVSRITLLEVSDVLCTFVTLPYKEWETDLVKTLVCKPP